MSFTRVTDLIDEIEAFQLNQYGAALEGDSGAAVPILLTALNDQVNYSLQVGNLDTVNGRALRVLKPDLTNAWLDITTSGVTVEKLRLRQTSTPSAPGSGLSEVYPKTDGRIYSRSGAGGSEVGYAFTTEAPPAILTTTGDLIYASGANTPARLAVGASGQVLTSDGSTPSWQTPETLIPIRSPIINGGFEIWQRGTSMTLPALAGAAYLADRFLVFNGADATLVVSQSTDVPAIASLVPFSNFSHDVNVTVADATISGAQSVYISQRLEGYLFAPFLQKQFTLGMWLKFDVAGTYSVFFFNATSAPNDRTYVAEFTIGGGEISTWVYRTVTVTPSPSSGIWNTTNGSGLNIGITLAAGSGVQQASAADLNTWKSNSLIASPNQTNTTLNTTGKHFKLWGVTMGLGPTVAPYWPRPYPIELALCQRYYELAADPNSGNFIIRGYTTTGGASIQNTYTYKVQKRATPTVTKVGTWTLGGFAVSQPIANTGDTSCFIVALAPGTTGDNYAINSGAGTTITISAEL